MNKRIELIPMSRQFLLEQPAAAGQGLAEMMRDAGDAFGVVLIGTRDEAARFQDKYLGQLVPIDETQP